MKFFKILFVLAAFSFASCANGSDSASSASECKHETKKECCAKDSVKCDSAKKCCADKKTGECKPGCEKACCADKKACSKDSATKASCADKKASLQDSTSKTCAPDCQKPCCKKS